MEIIIIFLIIIPITALFVDFCYFSFNLKTFLNKWVDIFCTVVFTIIYPIIFLGFVDEGDTLDCCINNVIFAPNHRIVIYFLIFIIILAFWVSKLFMKTISPLIEVVLNILLLLGIVFLSLLTFHIEKFYLFGTLPIFYVFLKQLYFNNIKIQTHFGGNEIFFKSKVVNYAFTLLRTSWYKKYPILVLLFIPIIIIVASFAMLFGQQPDSLIKAFTETYYLGFSQLTHQCDNVQCGGHYLCSVAANGNKNVVKPKRLGIRNGNLIICNRQLLVANAFENLLEENAPFIHRIIRKYYDRIGDCIHNNYSFYNNKTVSDIVYILMKPLEWLFLLFLYCFDKNPENRIEKQYTTNKF